MLVANTGEASLSIVSLSRSSQVRVPLGSPIPADGRPAAGKVFAVVPAGNGDSLAVINLATRTVTRMVFLGVGAGARGTALLGDSVAFVALKNRPGVARVSLDGGEVVFQDTGSSPKDVTLARARLFVTHANVEPCPVEPTECPLGESWLLVLDPNTLGRTGGRDSIPIPGPGNASYASVAADGRLYVLSRGGPESPSGRLTIVDPVSRTEVGSFGGIGDLPGAIAADRGERVMISSPTEGLMEFNTRTRTVVRGAGAGIPVITSGGVTTDSRNQIYAIEVGSCLPGSPGRARVFLPDLTEAPSVMLGVCPRAAITTLIPPAEDPANR